jgi:hypothetical protein
MLIRKILAFEIFPFKKKVKKIQKEKRLSNRLEIVKKRFFC